MTVAIMSLFYILEVYISFKSSISTVCILIRWLLQSQLIWIYVVLFFLNKNILVQQDKGKVCVQIIEKVVLALNLVLFYLFVIDETEHVNVEFSRLRTARTIASN